MGTRRVAKSSAPRFCSGIIPPMGDNQYERGTTCGQSAAYLCKDLYGRYILPRCEMCGEAFTFKRRIE